LLVNFYDYLDNDPDLTRDDILGCVRSMYGLNDKLFHLPINFTIYTAVGKSTNVGSELHFTIDEMFNLYNSLPKDTYLYSFGGKAILSRILETSITDFIDYESGKCSFTSDKFINILKFAKNYNFDDNYNCVLNQPPAIDYARNDEIYLFWYFFENIKSYITAKYAFGVDDNSDFEIVFKGFPSSSSHGTIINTMYTLAITDTSKVKEGAWEFIKYCISDEIQTTKVILDTGFPVKTSALRTALNEAMEKYYHPYDSAGYIWVLTYEESWGLPKPIYRLTQTDADRIFNFLNTVESRRTDKMVMDIITEELNVFWAGDVSAERCAEIIQSRVFIYVNEQR